MLRSSRAASFSFLVLAVAACDVEPGADPGAEPTDPILEAAGCAVLAEEVVPGTFGWDATLAVDAGGVVHVAASNQHATREPGGAWRLREEAFGATGYLSPRLVAGSGGTAVAHTGDGLRVARADQEGGWVTLLDRPAVQCSGNPYVEELEIAADGRVLVHSSEGPFLFTPGGAAEDLGDLGRHHALDDVGTMLVGSGDPLVIEDRFGEHTLTGHGAYVRDVGASARGEVVVLVTAGEEPGLIAHVRDAQGSWSEEPLQVVTWAALECADDPSPGERCTGTATDVETATVHAPSGALMVSVVLRETTLDLEWNSWPAAGGIGTYWGWEGERVTRHRVHTGALRDGRITMTPLEVPEPGDDEPPPRVVIDGRGDRHVLVGNRYMHVGCGG